MKKRLLLALTALSVATLALGAACGGDDDDGDGASASSNAGTTDTSSAAGEEAASDAREGWPDVFRLGLFGGDDAEDQLQSYEPLRALLEEELGIPIEIFQGTNYSAVIEAMRADRIDGMSVGPFSYILAVQEAQAEAIAVGISTTAEEPVYDEEILPYYVSVIFTKKGNGITTIEDIRGKGFNFVDPASTSGHLAPKTRLINMGYDPENDFETVFAGSHPTSVISVWNDKAPAGATNEGNLQRLDLEGQVDWCEWSDGRYNVPRGQDEIDAHFESCPDGSIVVLAQTDPIPNTPFAVRQSLPESFKTAVKDILLSTVDNPEYISERKNWYVDPSVELGLETLDQFYNPLRDIAQLLDLDLRELAEDG